MYYVSGVHALDGDYEEKNMTAKNAYIGTVEIKALGENGSPVVVVPVGVSITFVGITGASTITLGTGGYIPGVLSAGQLISVVGASNAGNNGVKTVSSVTSAGDVITVEDLLINEVSTSASITALP